MSELTQEERNEIRELIEDMMFHRFDDSDETGTLELKYRQLFFDTLDQYLRHRWALGYEEGYDDGFKARSEVEANFKIE